MRILTVMMAVICFGASAEGLRIKDGFILKKDQILKAMPPQKAEVTYDCTFSFWGDENGNPFVKLHEQTLHGPSKYASNHGDAKVVFKGYEFDFHIVFDAKDSGVGSVFDPAPFEYIFMFARDPRTYENFFMSEGLVARNDEKLPADLAMRTGFELLGRYYTVYTNCILNR